MRPMQPHAYDPARVIYPCLVQPKMVGQHVLYQAGYFQDKDEHPLDPNTMARLTIPLKKIFDEKTILEGVLSGGFHVFDCVRFRVPFKERMETVAQVLRDTQKKHECRPVPTRKMFDEQQANDQYDFWLNEGYLGMIYRLGNCFYNNTKGRKSWQLLDRAPHHSTLIGTTKSGTA
jgi:hypothetical protein